MKTIKISLVLFSLFLTVGIFGQCPAGLNKPGTFSQSGTTVPLPAAVTDGNSTTLALSFLGSQNSPMIVIDLGAKFDLTSILFIWGSTNKPSNYAVYTSTNGTDYTMDFFVTGNTASSDSRPFSATAKYIQYVKISSLSRVSPYTIDLYDIQICGTASCGSSDGTFKKLTVCEAANFYSGITSFSPSTFGTINTTTMSATGTISAGSFYTSGHVGIGCSNPAVELAVNGKIQAREIEVKSAPCADYVFEKNYKLMNIHDLDKFVAANMHLPEVPSAEEFNKKGMNISEMNNLLLKKVEELTLYTIELNRRIEELEGKNK